MCSLEKGLNMQQWDSLCSVFTREPLHNTLSDRRVTLRVELVGRYPAAVHVSETKHKLVGLL